uniref:GrpE protein homolog n=1 Tax=Paulinella micropora TaxID=1928728 RepID=A0A385I0A1_9EUKA|nr:heat shock protein GrpE [Paulinella micropora]AXY63353.1 heat shock protein GrpE [Paulinella micropora]
MNLNLYSERGAGLPRLCKEATSLQYVLIQHLVLASMNSDMQNSSQDSTNDFLEISNELTDIDGKSTQNESISDENICEDKTENSQSKDSLSLEELQSAYNTLSLEKESLQGQYVRIAADFDNFRKRQIRDQEELRLQITCSTLEAILPVVDNFERARQQLDPQTEEGQELHRSYQGLYKQLVDIFKQMGVSPMRVEGELFDPNLHEAVLREPSDVYAEDIITDELQRGYQLNGKVLRHALVKVSMGPGSQVESTQVSSEGSTD